MWLRVTSSSLAQVLTGRQCLLQKNLTGTYEFTKRLVMWWCILGSGVDLNRSTVRSDHVQMDVRRMASEEGALPSVDELVNQRILLFGS